MHGVLPQAHADVNTVYKMLIEPLPQGDLAKRKRHERVGRPPRHYNFIQEITGIPKLRQHLLRGDRRGWCLSGFFVVRSDSLRNSSQDLYPLVKLIIVSACLQEPEKAVAFSTPQKSVTKHPPRTQSASPPQHGARLRVGVHRRFS